jgi:hypothetical protein
MVRFDEAVTIALRTLEGYLASRETSITLVRDVTGQLSAVLPHGALNSHALSEAAAALHKKLEAYSPGLGQVLLQESDLLDKDDVLSSSDRVRLPDAGNAWLVDRLLTNQDWLRRPLLDEPPVPLGVGFSLKGGVGRSTAIAVLAWHLARGGKRVLVVDLDLEAPGIGNLLLEQLPDYGLIDWLVEALVGQSASFPLRDCLARSSLADDSPGIIQVIPAFGDRTTEYVAKVGRIQMPGMGEDLREQGVAVRLATLLKAFSQLDEPPEAVLLDSRAGLHDIGAAAVTQLAGEVFLFGRDEPQSWQAYRRLFEHLARSRAVEFGMPDSDLRWRLKMVAAMLDKPEGALASWTESSYELWGALYDDESRGAESSSALTFARDDTASPHYPLPVYFDGALRGLSLAERSERPSWAAVEAAFGQFLSGATSRLLPKSPQ